MEKFGKILDSFNSSKPKSKLTREMVFLAEQSAEGDIKVLPGKEWALHYPKEEAERKEKLQGLLDGKYKAEEVSKDISPDALLYNARDIETEGLEAVSARIRDLTSFVSNYDHKRFAQFVESMKGHNVPLEELENLYSNVTQARVQKKMIDSYGHTGRQQIMDSLKNESKKTIENIDNLPRSQKVLKALKINWLAEDMGAVSMEERDRVISKLSGDERKLFEELKDSYKDYIKTGNEEGYSELTETVREGFPTIQKEVGEDGPSESMQELEKELEEFKEEAVPPSTPNDPAIPPEDNDEYHTPPPPPEGGGESKEKMRARTIFEIDPALGGYYISGRKSYYDIDSKTWSKKKQISEYAVTIQGNDRSTISGVLSAGVKALPIPNGYALDKKSLKYKGSEPKIFRDQNGCFYLKSDGVGTFSIDFQKEPSKFINNPIKEDTAPLYRGSLSAKTEATISRLSGGPLQKAEQARQYILANHFYPGGGDLEKAGALQHKLRTQSNGDNYLQNIDSSEYLECYSANTKFVAMMRKVNVPARLIIGHKVEGSQNGKSAITQNTGHAWSEIWDGSEWRRFDATPNPKPEDKKKEDDKSENKDPADEAEDGGIDSPEEKKQKSEGKGEKGEKSDESSDSGNPLDEMGEASDGEMKDSQSEMQKAKEKMEQVEKEKEELQKKADDADSFKDLSELKKEIEKSEIFDEMKEELQDKLDAKEDQMKDKIKDELDKMVEDGFMDEKKRDEILKELEEKKLEELDKVQKQMEMENSMYNEYEDIREDVAPLVDKWFKYFAERLPRQDEIGLDQDSLMRQGAFNRKAVMRSRNLLFGTVKNPREIRPSIKPRFVSKIVVDVSGSMAQNDKLKSARKLLVFYSELFSKISEEFGYIKFSIDTFSDSVIPIKQFTQDYDSPTHYVFPDGSESTVKVRLMHNLNARGGTDMLPAIKNAAGELTELVEDYPDYASALYFIGDGGDTQGNSENIKQFLQLSDSERGFGEHMYSAVLLGGEAQKSELSNIFGEEHTNVAPDFDELIEKSMDKFDEDIEAYLRTKTK